jgi:hypothetical protein
MSAAFSSRKDPIIRTREAQLSRNCTEREFAALIAGMQLANGLCIPSPDQFLDNGGFGRVALGFYAVNVSRNTAVQNCVHAYNRSI